MKVKMNRMQRGVWLWLLVFAGLAVGGRGRADSANSSSVAVDIKLFVTNNPSGGGSTTNDYLYNYAVACGSSLNTGTSAAGTIQGDVIATSVKDKKNKITGTKTIATINVQNLIDLQPYLIAASNNGAYFNGDQAFHTYAPPGGIAWINGNVTLKGNITGCIIATGNIFANGGYTQIKVGNYPALISQNGTVGGNNSTAHGLVYARMGSLDLGGNFTITGSAICNAAISSFSGGSSVIYEYCKPVPPNYGGNQPSGNLKLTGWQK